MNSGGRIIIHREETSARLPSGDVLHAGYGVPITIPGRDHDRLTDAVIERAPWMEGHHNLGDAVYEAYVNEIVAAKVADLVQFAANHYYTRYGDGEGGLLVRDVERALGRDRPRPTEPAAQPQPTATHRRLHRLANRDGCWDCAYCGKPIGCTCMECLDKAVIEHMFPRSRGGSNDDGNCVLACYSCNTKKGDKTPSEWGVQPWGWRA